MELGAVEEIRILSTKLLEEARHGNIGGLRKLIDLPGTLAIPFIASVSTLPDSELIDAASSGLSELREFGKKGDAETEALTAICATLASVEALGVLSSTYPSVRDILSRCSVSSKQIESMSSLDSETKAKLADLVPSFSNVVLVADAREVVMLFVPHENFKQVVWIQDVPPGFPVRPLSQSVGTVASQQAGAAVNLLDLI